MRSHAGSDLSTLRSSLYAHSLLCRGVIISANWTLTPEEIPTYTLLRGLLIKIYRKQCYYRIIHR